MIVNFNIVDFSALNYKGRHIDLHNNFDFIGSDYEIVSKRLVLTWKKSIGNWVKVDEFSKLTLIHSNVSFLNYNYDNNTLSSFDNCLSEITFFPSTERTKNKEFIDQAKPKEDDDIIYSFVTDHFIRVGCENILLIPE